MLTADLPSLPCPEGLWKDWGECSESCGGGIQTREKVRKRVKKVLITLFLNKIKVYFVNLVAGQELCVREEAEPCNTHDCRKPLPFYVS